jgi:predicted phage terminase large subunit-like protein
MLDLLTQIDRRTNYLNKYLPKIPPQSASINRVKPVASLSGFQSFVAKANPRFKWHKHCIKIALVLIRVANGELNRVMIFAPPRHGKSEELSRLFSAYYLSLFPDRWVGINSYAADLAYTLSRSARQNYQANGGVVKDDAAAVKHWETPNGGGLWAAGVGGPITGKGFHLGIIDDPIKNAEEAASEVVNAGQRDWYSSTFYTREEPGGAIVIMMTRWNQMDLCGWLLSQEAEGEEPERWHVVSFEAIKEETPIEVPATCTLESDDRAVGEPLCEERYPLANLRKIAKRIGTYFWNALYRQRPAPREGLMFKLHQLPIVKAAPAGPGITRIRYWDLGGSDSKKADYSVGCLMSRTPDGLFYIEDVQRGQWSPKERNEKIKATAKADKKRFQGIRTWIERVPGLAVEVIDSILRLLAGYAVYAEMVQKNKETRADPLASQCEAGNVRLVEAEWNAAFREELTAFPHGSNDDQVDGASGAFGKLSQGATTLGVVAGVVAKGWVKT